MGAKATSIKNKSRKLVLVGDEQAGKTSLISSFLSNQFPASAVTHPSKTVRVHNHEIELHLFDTPGADEYDRVRPLSYSEAEASLICFSIDDPQSIDRVALKWAPEVRHFIGRAPMILVACKIDLRDDPETISELQQQGEQPINTKFGKKLASKIHADAYVECSAKTHEGVEELFLTVAQLAIKRKAPALK